MTGSNDKNKKPDSFFGEKSNYKTTSGYEVTIDVGKLLGKDWFIRGFHKDLSLWQLLLSHSITIIIAIVQHWDLWTIAWIYWGQSLVIGYFKWQGIMHISRISTEGMTLNDQTIMPSTENKKKLANIFISAYAGFLMAIMLFLVIYGLLHPAPAPALLHKAFYIVICVMLFFVVAFKKYKKNEKQRASANVNIGLIMFYSFMRIIPLQLTVLIGLWLNPRTMAGLLLFLVLAMFSDSVMHIIDNATIRTADKKAR